MMDNVLRHWSTSVVFARLVEIKDSSHVRPLAVIDHTGFDLEFVLTVAERAPDRATRDVMEEYRRNKEDAPALVVPMVDLDVIMAVEQG